MAKIVILGAGPAGLGAAVGLARNGHDVTVIEQTDRVGGNAGSFELAGLRVDYGSHRFHPAADPQVFALVRELLGDDLLERPRHGRIRLGGRWIHFPLEAVDLARHAPPRFVTGVIVDMGRKLLPSGRAIRSADDTFASVLQRGLGRTICREFYFPYARKIWGLEPDQISPTQAYKRVAAGSIGKLLRRLVPGTSAGRNGAAGSKRIFYYPRNGYGQICEALKTAAEGAGARVLLGTTVTRVELAAGQQHRTEVQSASARNDLPSDYVWSTIPVTTLVRQLAPPAPPAIAAAAAQLKLRAMLLVYLTLGTDRFTEFDAHYFPEEGLPFTRLSEPKNYSTVREPKGVTVLCAEIPCNRSDSIWSSSDAELGELVREGLARARLPVRCPLLDITVRRLPAAYPIYGQGYEAAFDSVDRWINGLDGLLSFGRQGLYAHDNTHHALFMALAAVDCLRGERFDRNVWNAYREQFAAHVVED
jgi:protoporphyrinogen oxidase